MTIDSEPGESYTGTDEKLTHSSAKRVLLGVIHELQYYERMTCKSTMNTQMKIFPQLLADMTSTSPLYQAIVFSFSDSVSIDIRGMWRQTFTTVFDEILHSDELNEEII